ncbi:MAG: hypothetical protein AAGG48_28030 [Planctomycetota bacterium]
MHSKVTIHLLLLYTLAFAMIFAASKCLGVKFIPICVIAGTLIGRLVADLSTQSRSARWFVILTFAWTSTVFACLWDLDFQIPEWSVWAQASPVLFGYGIVSTLIVQLFFLLGGSLKLLRFQSRTDSA